MPHWWQRIDADLFVSPIERTNSMDKDRLYGNCHCGTVQFSISRNIDMSAVRRCDCSLCKRRGAVMLACPIEDVKIEAGAVYIMARPIWLA